MKTIHTYKSEEKVNRKIKVPMPKYRAGQELLVNLNQCSAEFDPIPQTVIIERGIWDIDEKEWSYVLKGRKDVCAMETDIPKIILN